MERDANRRAGLGSLWTFGPRALRLFAGVALLGVALESAREVLVAFRDPLQGPQLPGLQIIGAVALVLPALSLLRQSILRAPTPSVVTYALTWFGYGWLLGVLVNDLVALIRRRAPTYDGPASVALDIFSWLMITAVFAIPGLVSLLIARRL